MVALLPVPLIPLEGPPTETMDPTTPVNVAKGAAATCEFVLQLVVHLSNLLTASIAVVAGTFAALHGLYRGTRHPGPLALSAGANGGTAGAIFFGTLCSYTPAGTCTMLVPSGIREVVVGPLLEATLRRSEHAQATPSLEGAPQQPSWAHLRIHGLLDSATSGALTGAIINKWRSMSNPFPIFATR